MIQLVFKGPVQSSFFFGPPQKDQDCNQSTFISDHPKTGLGLKKTENHSLFQSMNRSWHLLVYDQFMSNILTNILNYETVNVLTSFLTSK